MQEAPLMPKATAVWLVENTALSFDQVADFCKLHPLEVKAIADDEGVQSIMGRDPIVSGQLTRDELAKGEADPNSQFTITMKDEDFVKLMNGELNGQVAFMSGKLKFKGSMSTAMKLQGLLF